MSGAEGDESGDRALSTVLIGVEGINRLTGRGFFAAAGLGIGRATLSGAHSGPMGPNPFRSIPNRDETGFAFGLGLGVRSYNGPGPLGLQMALRFHGLAAGGRVAASAAMFTLGLAY